MGIGEERRRPAFLNASASQARQRSRSRIKVCNAHQSYYIRIMRTTLMLSDDVYVAAKKIAASSGRSLGEVVSQLVRKGLVSEPSFNIENGIPVFRVGGSDEPIPGGRAAELLDEEA
jgi:hypothetical protein